MTLNTCSHLAWPRATQLLGTQSFCNASNAWWAPSRAQLNDLMELFRRRKSALGQKQTFRIAIVCVDVYGPRPIATGRRDQVQWSQLLTYIRLPDAARYFVAASPDGFSRASTSTAPRHWPRPCRSTHQVREATE